MMCSWCVIAWIFNIVVYDGIELTYNGVWLDFSGMKPTYSSVCCHRTDL